jgi:N-terminal acetyltransferase B complex non-catalytic subunit
MSLTRTFKDPPSAAFLDRLVSYIKRFGSSIVCFEDVKGYLSHFSGSSLETELLGKLKMLVTETSSVNGVRLAVNVDKIEFILSGGSKSLSFTKTYVDKYRAALGLGKDLDERERQYGDDYILLSVMTFLNAYTQDPQPSHLLESIALLEYALKKSPYNFHFKILLVRMYVQLGVFNRAWEVYKTLEIKQVMHDTLS